MNRRDALTAIASCAFWPAISPAQESKRVPVIGMLITHAPVTDPVVEAMRNGLRQHGYEDGKNIKLEVRTALGQWLALGYLAPMALGYPAPTLPRAAGKGGGRLRWCANLSSNDVGKGKKLASKLPPLRATRGWVGEGARIDLIAKSIPQRALLAATLLLSALFSSLTFADNTKLPKIGELFFQDQNGAAPYQRALRNGLRELGYVDGKTATFVTRFADGNAEKLAALLADVFVQKPDVVFVSPRALSVARQMTTTTPLVTFFSDPIAEGLVKSFARPGGNITGVSWQSNESSGKRLQYTMELVPGLKRVTLLYDPGDPSTVLDAEASRKAALGVGFAVDLITFRNAAELDISLAQIARAKSEAMIVVHTPLTVHHRDEIIRFAIRSKLPLVSEGPDWAHAGALLSYGPSIVDMFTRAAGYMGKILKGAKPGELPIEQPTVFELVVNEKTAKVLGIKIPESIMLRADEVIR